MTPDINEARVISAYVREEYGIWQSWWPPVAFVALALLFYGAIAALIWLLWRML